MLCKEKKVSTSSTEMDTSSEFRGSPPSPGKGFLLKVKGGDMSWPDSTNLGELLGPQNYTHTSPNFISLTVRGEIKHGFPSTLLKAWGVESVWNQGGGHLERSKDHCFLVNTGNSHLLQDHGIFVCISKNQWEGLTDDRDCKSCGHSGLLWGSPGTVQFAPIPEPNLTQFADLVLICRVNLAWCYYLEQFVFSLPNHFRGSWFPFLFSDRGDGS